MAKFYGIGTGPGAADLLTVRGKQVLEKLDCLYTPAAKKQGQSLALSIVHSYLPPDLEIRQRHFPMTNQLAEKKLVWEEIAAEICDLVQAGKNVGFITLGDPMVYSTYSYLLERLKPKIATETVPGISAFSNMANSLEIPLVMDDESYVVLPATTSEELIELALKAFSTIVLMKVSTNFPKVYDLIAKQQLLEQTVLISHSGQPQEQTWLGLAELARDADLSYFSTLIVYKTRKLGDNVTE